MVSGCLSSWSAISPAGLGRGQVDQGPEPWCCVHHHGEGGRDLADPEVHHLQPHPGPGGRGQRQCAGGKSCQKVIYNNFLGIFNSGYFCIFSFKGRTTVKASANRVSVSNLQLILLSLTLSTFAYSGSMFT